MLVVDDVMQIFWEIREHMLVHDNGRLVATLLCHKVILPVCEHARYKMAEGSGYETNVGIGLNVLDSVILWFSGTIPFKLRICTQWIPYKHFR